MIYLMKKEVPDRNRSVYSQFLYTRCDVATFNIPYFSWRVGEPKPERFDEEFSEYIEDKMKYLLNDLEPYILEDYFSNLYFGSERSYMMRIIVLELNDETEFLVPDGSIYDYGYPEDFEDLCLFSKGKCFLKSVTHEDLCWLYPTYDFEVEYLKKLGAKLKLLSEEDTDYTIDYHISLDYKKSKG